MVNFSDYDALFDVSKKPCVMGWRKTGNVVKRHFLTVGEKNTAKDQGGCICKKCNGNTLHSAAKRRMRQGAWRG
ncbi:hypothetical protein JMJ77_0005068 [Colletotrichum scovillei]|uniref:Uncharacterized protein n=1 Tax=Colletotrichum scovillei TaxID=1209932 RepID=A0A9P7ULZ3_9PEZI|nr:hypothetical protein JMJ77_0005068 [Colletotrichum scovillei]KAG7076272.1 hypothetical protein JMJ76_0013538 [Colletotrichum scovillei]KAG7083447.1 hypothetical protein JMJ78_0008892 [Colletotrichum scovillei]